MARQTPFQVPCRSTIGLVLDTSGPRGNKKDKFPKMASNLEFEPIRRQKKRLPK